MFNFKLDPLVCYNTLLLLSFNSLIWIPWKSKFELLQVYKPLSNYAIRNTVLMVEIKHHIFKKIFNQRIHNMLSMRSVHP